MRVEDIDQAGISNGFIFILLVLLEIAEGVADGIFVRFYNPLLTLASGFRRFVKLRGIRARRAVQAGAGYLGHFCSRFAHNAVVHSSQPVTARANMYGISGHKQVTLPFVRCHCGCASLSLFQNLHMQFGQISQFSADASLN